MNEIENQYNQIEWLFCESYDKLETLTIQHQSQLRQKNISFTFEALRMIKDDLANLYDETITLLNNIRDYTSTHNIHSIFSDINTFQESYNEGLVNFQSKNFEALEKQFIENEVDYLVMSITDFDLLENELKYSFLAKIDFLEKKAKFSKSANIQAQSSKTLTNLELVYLFDKLHILTHLYEEEKYNKTQTSKILGKILGTHPQDIRALLSRIVKHEKFGDRQRESFKGIDTFLNSL